MRDPQWCLAAPLRIRKGIYTTIIGKNPAWASYLAVRARMGPFRSPHGLFTGCLWPLNPYGSRKLIMHALKLYGPRTERQNSYGAARGLCGPREWTYSFCSNSPGTAREQPGNSSYGARECDVTEAWVNRVQIAEMFANWATTIIKPMVIWSSQLRVPDKSAWKLRKKDVSLAQCYDSFDSSWGHYSTHFARDCISSKLTGRMKNKRCIHLYITLFHTRSYQF